ncbi:MAG TPA: methylthioribulose 1-phosphate dehydratase [Sphingomonas sp.]|nr:methylthioribulose 1-phosphate dehydratase [Sphingomonas sp.]
MDQASAVAALIAAARRLDRRGLAAATSGNHSARLADGSIAITRSGTHTGRLTPLDFMRIDDGGAPIDPGRPSAETALHLMLYRRFPATGAILHWHSPGAVGWSRAARDDRWVFAGHEMLKAFPGVTTHDTRRTLPLVDNSQDMADIESALAPVLGAADALPAFMIRAHGIYAWGKDVDEAERVAEAIEWLIAAELAERSFRA